MGKRHSFIIVLVNDLEILTLIKGERFFYYLEKWGLKKVLDGFIINF